MDSKIATAAVLAVVGLTGTAVQSQTATAADAMQKCYGVARHGHNDCAAGAHSCAGMATRDRDPESFVYLPVGACSKIAGGKLAST